LSLQSGLRLGQYEVLAKLGEGGMGEVYRAKDTTLGREVALKVLPASVAGDPERLARFEREAKLLASLNHANIATLHALERFENRHVLVMELVPGDDLTTRIARGPMPLDEALPIAIQIAHALEAAHERGVVHRDLKPANIKVSDDGAVKVLDFGLAKALGPEDSGSTSNAMNSPTLTAHATAAGIILGTAAYMSPEQARGRTADKRADIWAFGAILFEMLTGARLFEGETISDTLAAVLRQDLPWARLPASTPNELRRLLRRLLERDRKNRLHDIADARLVLEEVARGGAEDTPAPIAAPSRSRARWPLAAVAGLALLAVGAALGRYVLAPAPSASAETIRLIVPMPPGVTNIRYPAVSPDGRFVVFTGQAGSRAPKLYLHYFNAAMPRAIEGTDGALHPFVSPDARWIGFRRNNRLERISVDGGQPLGIADASTSGPSSTWLPGGPIVFAASWLVGLSAVSPEGGEVRSLTTLNASRNEIGHWFPSALPDGRHVLFTVWLKTTGLDDAEVALLDVRTGTYRILFKGAEARYVAPGAIVYFRAGTYQAVRFDLDSLEPSGDPVRVLEDARGNIPEGGNVHTDIAAQGTAAYESTPSVPESRLVWVSPGGALEELPFPVRRYGALSLATDGRRVAVDVVEAGRYSIRLLDLSPNQRADDAINLPGTNWGPIWHPDGKHLAFIAMRKGDFDTYWKDVTSTAAAEPLLVTDGDDIPVAFSDDGRTLIVEQSESNGTYPLKRMSLPPPGKQELVLPDDSDGAVVSPDNKYIAYVSERTGEVYVLPLVGGGVPERVSTGGGEAVAWSANSRELYYARPPEILAVTLGQEGPRLRPMGERVWARVNQSWPQQRAFAIGKDGRILIALPKEPVIPQIRVILGWDQEIAQKLRR
jgi:serine/threonine-protein kinase